MQKATIIGSGIAGIASALRLRSKGYEVDVFEANSYPGGKLHAFESKGYKFDYGPSLFTMPHFVEELFELLGEQASDHFHYHQKETICNYFWEDGTRFIADSDKEKFMIKAAETFHESRDALKKYLSNSATKYDLTTALFLEKSLHKLSTYLSKQTITSILNIGQLDLTSTLDQVNRRYFKSEKVIQLFNRYATYNGSTPYQTPGIMSLIPQLETRFGTFYPRGGMHTITTSLYDLAKRNGVNFFFNEKVEKIEIDKKKVTGIRVSDQTFKSDLVVCNMDVFSAYRSLLTDQPPPKKILRQERSSSALIFYWGIKKTFPELDLHNIFFSDHYQREFEYLFDKKDLFDDPTVYVNITSKEDHDHAPPDSENWFVMINAPGNVGQNWEELIITSRKRITTKLSRILGVEIEPLIETEEIVDPRRIERETLSHQGSLYGTSSNSRFAAFLRHPNFSKNIKNLYFCGGSAHPGGGIPLCLLSAKIVGDLVTPLPIHQPALN